MKIAIVNGPNLNLIGTREPSIYGNQSLSSYLSSLTSNTPIEISIFHSNIEGEIIDYLQNTLVDGFIINAGGYSHTSVAIRDCISSIISPVVEVHISNITSRESFRHESLLSPVCEGCIFGFGLESYRLALNYFENKTVK
jgi:3-dehydroquinate dehydratase-2